MVTARGDPETARHPPERTRRTPLRRPRHLRTLDTKTGARPSES